MHQAFSNDSVHYIWDTQLCTLGEDIIFTKVPIVKTMVFFSSHVQWWELGHKVGWGPKDWCFWTVVLEKTLESLLDGKEIKTINSKGIQPWIFIGRTEAEAEAPVLWPDSKSWLSGRDPDPGKDWRPKEKRAAEDMMVRQHHRLNRHEFEQTRGDCEGQGSLACCSPRGHRVGHDLVTEQQQQQQHHFCLQ